MMKTTALPFQLSHDQAARLQAYAQAYRRYAFASIPPSPGRNTMLRSLQAVQGRLIACMDHHTEIKQVVFAAEEVVAIKKMVTELLALYAKQPESAERIATLADLAALKGSLKASSER